MSTTRTLSAHRIVALLESVGVDAFLAQSGGGTGTIYAGPQHEEPGWGPRFAALAGPGSYGRGVFYAAEVIVGRDDDGDQGDYWVGDPETVTEEEVAAQIAARVRQTMTEWGMA